MAAAITVKGVDEVRRRLDEIGQRARDTERYLRVAAEDLKTLVDDSFYGSRSPGGRQWEPLDPSTVAKKGSSKPLIDTGALRNSITTRARRDAVLLGTNLPYAPVHQYGGEHIPARPYLPITGAGEFMDRGPAATFKRQLLEDLRHWILTGQIR